MCRMCFFSCFCSRSSFLPAASFAHVFTTLPPKSNELFHSTLLIHKQTALVFEEQSGIIVINTR